MSLPVRIAVIGLGYVGLPLAVALGRKFPVVGYDKSEERIAEVRRGMDRTGEIGADILRGSSITLTADPSDLCGQRVFIITVPTPVDDANKPDLSAVMSACRTVGRALLPGAVVVLESTVYPGVTEDVCGPILAEASGLACGRDFHLGYSPERINPGDREHTVDRITKVVSGQTAEVAKLLAEVYGAITSGGVFVAKSIRVAEAAKVIENAQRDINIAFINEVTMIFNRLGLSIHDVLAASATKWNFYRFLPGLVGGHCIGVDPYYLADIAQRVGHNPEVILAGRRINDRMGMYIADRIADQVAVRPPGRHPRVLVLGLTFKENVRDLRNSKVIDIIRGLRGRSWTVDVHDPFADPVEARREYGVELLASLDSAGGYDVVIGAVAHDQYRQLSTTTLGRLLRSGGMLADVKGMWRGLALPSTISLWEI